MRVALVCPYSWSLPGGVQTHVRGLADALRGRGIHAEVIAPADGRVEEGVHVVGRTLRIRDNGSVVPVALSPGSARRSVRLVRQGGFDVVHVHEPMIPAVSLAALLGSRAPLVGTFHRYAEGPGWYRPFGPLSRSALRRLDARIAVSDAARRHVQATCPGEYELVANGIDAGPPPAGGPAASDGDAGIAFVGRDEPRKGLPVLLEAFARLPGRPRLELIGVTPDELRRRSGAIPGLSLDRVHAHGRVDDDRRDALLRGADLLCAPALRGESFGIVIAEAMAAGLPVVASAVGGFPELVGDDAGLVVPPGDVAATADALARLLGDRRLREHAGRAARSRALGIDWSVVVHRVVDVYEEAARRRAGAGGRHARRVAAAGRPPARRPPGGGSRAPGRGSRRP